MKRSVLFILCIILAGAALLQAQETTSTYKEPLPARKNYISSGFYFQIGPVFPNGNYAYDQLVPVTNPNPPVFKVNYLSARIGAALDMGFLIYLGPSFANNHIRAGIDATFLSFWFNSTKPLDPANKYEHYYYFAGQKFGPVITINPIDRLMIDISYKLNANVAYHFDEWHSLTSDEYSKYGVNLTQNEVSLSIRYIIMKFAIQYNFGKMKFNNVDDSRPYQTIDANTLRIMVGLKF